jgi:two-component system, cell cycle response regulator
LRVLIAEDAALTRLALSRAVSQLGHEPLVVEDGLRAWEVIQQEHFDVLMTDWEMPRMTGPELCEKVRNAGLDSYIYVIVLTVRSATADRHAALAAGVDDFLTQPFDPVELAARLRVAERILGWSAQLQVVNDTLLDGARRLAETTAEIERLRAEAEHLANHDSLTGSLNRRAWFAQMHATRNVSAVAMFDIDYFKRVNDQFGHPAGDEVLIQVATRLADGPGVTARFGGEEFAVGFQCSLERAREWCESARREIGATTVRTVAGPVRVTVSAGLAASQGNVDATLRAADAALYAAKLEGRDQVMEWSPETAFQSGSSVVRLTPRDAADSSASA